jgi:hypothetical protein
VETETPVSSDTSIDTVSPGTQTETEIPTSSTSSETSDTQTESTDTFVETDSNPRNNPCYRQGDFLCYDNALYTCDRFGQWDIINGACQECDSSGYCGCDRTEIKCESVCLNGKSVERTNTYCMGWQKCVNVPGSTPDCIDPL